MAIQITDQFTISDEVLSQEVNGETVLLDLKGESYFGLNQVGTRVWTLLEADHSVADLVDVLYREYDTTKTELEIDVLDLLNSLHEAGLISQA